MKAQSFGLSTSSATERRCATRSLKGAGVVRRDYRAPGDGVITARLSGAEGADWDLAIVDKRTGKNLTGSAATDAQEMAYWAVSKGRKLVIQACRRSGATTARLNLQFTKVAFRKMAKELKGQKVMLVRVKLESKGDGAKLRRLGLDLADHGSAAHHDALIYGSAQLQALRASGLQFRVRESNVLAKRKRELRKELSGRGQRARTAQAPRGLRSGRTSYRRLEEFHEELRTLAAANSDIVRLVVLPRRSVEGREILGVEVAEGVGRADDGRPTFVNLGAHHAREWPSAEAPMEWLLDLVAGYREGDPRMVNIVRNARTFTIPVVNVDGYYATINSERNTLADPADDGTFQGLPYEQALGIGAYKRKNCSTGDPATQAIPCVLRTRSPSEPFEPPPPFDLEADIGLQDLGVDLNRNYGFSWGGPGTEHFRQGGPSGFGLTYHGPSPFSEPETQAVQNFARDLNTSVLIGNHTYTGLILRPPGTSTDGPAEDELEMRTLGDQMAIQTDYVSQFGYQLYDTTGTLDDYIYGALGAYAYTPEIGKENFHPNYSDGFVPEYIGREIQDYDTGAPTGQYLGGLREAYTIAAETAINGDSHSILRGDAPAGRTLRLVKDDVTFVTDPRPDDDGVNDPEQTFVETRTLSTQVPASGQFEWHVPPSRQPGRDPGEAGSGDWTLQCLDGDRVIEERPVNVERGQAVSMSLGCGVAAPTTPVAESCTPIGFERVRVTRRFNGRRLRVTFTKRTDNPVTFDVFRSSKGRKVLVNPNRVLRLRNRQRSFTWNGRGSGNRALGAGVYYLRLRVTDDQERVDARRIVVERKKNGTWVKRGKFVLEPRLCR